MRIKLKRNEHYQFYLLLAILIVLLFVRYTLQIDIPRIILTMIIAVIAICGDQDEIFAIAMCCIPLHEAVDLYYSIALCIMAYALKYPKRIRINSTIFLILMMVIWEILHCFEPGISLKILITTIIPMVFLAMVLCVDVSEVNYGFVIRNMGIILMTVCVTLLMNLIINANYNFIVAFSNLRRLGFASEGNSMIGGAINPNSLGIICVLVISACLQLRSVGQGKTSDIFLMLALLTFGALTSSRTFVVCLFIMVVLFIMGQKGGVKKKISFILSIIMVGVLAIILLYCFFPDLMEYYIDRFRVEDITTGRDTLMKIYHRYIVDNPNVMLFGIGLNKFVEKLTVIYRVSNNVPHNSIQEIIVAWGLPGLIMISSLFIVMVKNARKYSGKLIILNYIPMLIILAKMMAGQLLMSSYTMLALSFVYLSLCQDFKKAVLQSKKT